MKTIEIDKELILVEVPKDAFDLYTLSSSNELIYKLGNRWIYTGINCIIIGLIETPDLKFDFDVDESWIERYFIAHFYNYLTDKEEIMSKKQSFRTRIQRKIQENGLYLVNPIHKQSKQNSFDEVDFVRNREQWQQAEEKTIKGNLLLIEKV